MPQRKTERKRVVTAQCTPGGDGVNGEKGESEREGGWPNTSDRSSRGGEELSRRGRVALNIAVELERGS